MTDELQPGTGTRRRPRAGLRFLVAFLAGIVAVLGIGVGALYAYDRQYEGRVLPGVDVGGVDLSGLDAVTARSRLDEAYADVGRGRVILASPRGDVTLGYGELGRAPDVDSMVRAALAAGRETGISALVGTARTALHGVSIGPSAALDPIRLDGQLATLVAAFDRAPVDATIAIRDGVISITDSRPGQTVDVAALRSQLGDRLSAADAPAELRLQMPVFAVEPTLTTQDALAAKAAAERLTADLHLTIGTERWTIAGTTLRSLVSFTTTVDGGVTPIVDVAGLDPSIKAIARQVDRQPKNAKYVIGKGGTVVGTRPGATGRTLLLEPTRDVIVDALTARLGGGTPDSVKVQLKSRQPALTTEAAKRAAPLMKRLSTWTTWFPIGEKNGFGANIWLPARFVDGYVVVPGETFSFWKAVGPVTRARGFRQGGAIIDGRTQPQGALAGGICSCSTTLFNAALRAGYRMGARKNHFYFIDRYPAGLDATVFQSGGGSVQDMTWTNDTPYPVLIQGINTRRGGKGYVRFDLYSVPNGRQVLISGATVKNVRPATDTIQYTTSLPAGTAKRIEYPVAGKDVWVTVTVKEHGKVLSRRTYYSHYSRITGITLIGRDAD